MAKLLEVLQEGDAALFRQAQILMENPDVRDLFGFATKRVASGAIKQIDSLRKNLAHALDIVTHDWAATTRIASRIEEAVLLRRNRPASNMTTDTPSRGKKR